MKHIFLTSLTILAFASALNNDSIYCSYSPVSFAYIDITSFHGHLIQIFLYAKNANKPSNFTLSKLSNEGTYELGVESINCKYSLIYYINVDKQQEEMKKEYKILDEEFDKNFDRLYLSAKFKELLDLEKTNTINAVKIQKKYGAKIVTENCPKLSFKQKYKPIKITDDNNKLGHYVNKIEGLVKGDELVTFIIKEKIKSAADETFNVEMCAVIRDGKLHRVIGQEEISSSCANVYSTKVYIDGVELMINGSKTYIVVIIVVCISLALVVAGIVWYAFSKKKGQKFKGKVNKK